MPQLTAAADVVTGRKWKVQLMQVFRKKNSNAHAAQMFTAFTRYRDIVRLKKKI
jgi:hypothetical protein